MDDESDIFIQWLISRLLHKHNYDPQDQIIQKLHIIANKLSQPIYINIKDEELDLILSRYYPDFNLDKCEDISIGFSSNDRIVLRTTIKSIIFDIVNKIVPKETIIK